MSYARRTKRPVSRFAAAFIGVVAVFVVAVCASGCANDEINGSLAGRDAGNVPFDSGDGGPADGKVEESVINDDSSAKEGGSTTSDGGHVAVADGSTDDSGMVEKDAMLPQCVNYDILPLQKLWGLCSNRTKPCEGYTVDLRAFVDTGQFVGHYEDSGIILLAMPVECPLTGEIESKRLSVGYDPPAPYSPPVIPPGILDQTGWKAEITNASIEYFETYTGVDYSTYSLKGTADNLKFFRDLENKLPNYVVLKDTQGNLVLDTRK